MFLLDRDSEISALRYDFEAVKCGEFTWPNPPATPKSTNGRDEE